MMPAMALRAISAPPILKERPKHALGRTEALICVEACGVFRTDLHVFDGELPDPPLPIVCMPAHARASGLPLRRHSDWILSAVSFKSAGLDAVIGASLYRSTAETSLPYCAVVSSGPPELPSTPSGVFVL
jgi:hypothetical protein